MNMSFFISLFLPSYEITDVILKNISEYFTTKLTIVKCVVISLIMKQNRCKVTQELDEWVLLILLAWS